MRVGVVSSFPPLLGGWVRVSSSYPPTAERHSMGLFFTHLSQAPPPCVWLGKEGITLISRRPSLCGSLRFGFPAAWCLRWFGE